MKKRYQVFVSSTFEDLKQERHEIMHALLRLRCIPAGMELFTAANQQQWDLIKKVIDDSDYYVVIVGGRYGSIVPGEAISYTEKEYRYALESGIPILGFVHGDLSSIAQGKSDQAPENRKKLAAFTKLVRQKPVSHWTSPYELGRLLVEAIAVIKEEEPRHGWVRGDAALSEENIKQVLNLQSRIKELEDALMAKSSRSPAGDAETLGPIAKWVLQRIIFDNGIEFYCSSEGGLLRFIHSKPGTSAVVDAFEPKHAKARAQIREAINQLTSMAFIEKLRPA